MSEYDDFEEDAEESTDERIATALEQIASSLESIDSKLDRLENIEERLEKLDSLEGIESQIEKINDELFWAGNKTFASQVYDLLHDIMLHVKHR